MVEQENKRSKNKKLPPYMKGVKFMAKPILATPVLKGKDLVELARDLQRPDNNKVRREKALKILTSYSKGK